MRLQSLSLEGFRSYNKLTISFEPASHIELLRGANGAGKTNILEAIALLSIGKSCLGIDPDDLVLWGQDFFRVSGVIQTDGGEQKQLEAAFQLSPRRAKAYFLDGVRVPFAQFVGALPLMAFLPHDLEVFVSGPDVRRAFLDRILIQLAPTFLGVRLEYERILKQRNALLKRIAAGEATVGEAGVWDEQLAQAGGLLQQLRLELCESFSKALMGRFRELGEQFQSSQLTYVRSTAASGQEGIKAELLTLLQDCRTRDLAVCTTTVGPHRDDWRIVADSHNIATSLSRGQQRTAFVALLLSALELFASVRKERPVLLLDDVFSELDDAHQAALLTAASGHQTFITATHVPLSIGEDVRVWTVEGGRIVSR